MLPVAGAMQPDPAPYADRVQGPLGCPGFEVGCLCDLCKADSRRLSTLGLQLEMQP